MLAYIVAAFGVLIALFGLVAAAVPTALREFMRTLRSSRVMYAAIGFRLVAGAFFVLASEACSWPAAIGTIGVIMLAAGFIGLFIGIDRVKSLTSWFLAYSDTAFRLWAPGAVLFGAFIVYAAV